LDHRFLGHTNVSPAKTLLCERIETTRVEYDHHDLTPLMLDPLTWIWNGIWRPTNSKSAKRVFDQEDFQPRKKRLSLAVHDMETALARLREPSINMKASDLAPQGKTSTNTPTEALESSPVEERDEEDEIPAQPYLNEVDDISGEEMERNAQEEKDASDANEVIQERQSVSVKDEGEEDEDEDLGKLFWAFECTQPEKPFDLKSKSPASREESESAGEESEISDSDEAGLELESPFYSRFIGYHADESLEEMSADSLEEKDSEAESSDEEDMEMDMDFSWRTPDTSAKDESESDEWDPFPRDLNATSPSLYSPSSKKRAQWDIRDMDCKSMEPYVKKISELTSADIVISGPERSETVKKHPYYGTPEIGVETTINANTFLARIGGNLNASSPVIQSQQSDDDYSPISPFFRNFTHHREPSPFSLAPQRRSSCPEEFSGDAGKFAPTTPSLLLDDYQPSPILDNISLNGDEDSLSSSTPSSHLLEQSSPSSDSFSETEIQSKSRLSHQPSKSSDAVIEEYVPDYQNESFDGSPGLESFSTHAEERRFPDSPVSFNFARKPSPFANRKKGNSPRFTSESRSPLDSPVDTNLNSPVPRVSFTAINKKPSSNIPLYPQTPVQPNCPPFAAERFPEFITLRSPARQARLDADNCPVLVTPRSPVRQTRLESIERPKNRSLWRDYATNGEISESSEDIYLPNLKPLSPEIHVQDNRMGNTGGGKTRWGEEGDVGGNQGGGEVGIVVWEGKTVEMDEKRILITRVGKSVSSKMRGRVSL
jgi:hypothetical protein